MNRAIGFLIVAAASLGQARAGQLPPAGLPAADTQVDRTILMISLDDPGQAHVQQIVQGFQEVLVDAPRPPVLYLEFFDQVRFPQTTYPGEFYEWLSRKYRDRRIDVIVTVQQRTLQLLADQPGHRWQGLPVVYSSLGDLTIDISDRLPMATGVVRENNFPAALRTIKTLLPDTTRIALIYGASRAERERNLWFVSQVPAAGLEVVDLGGLAIDDLLARVAQLPPGTVPFFLEFQADATGRTFTHSRACQEIAAAANRPLFGLFRHYFGCGVVGGPLTDFAEVGRLLARHSLKRLGPESAATVTVPVGEYAPLVFDARQLTRWDIPENRLPAGSAVLFRPPSLWRDYRREVIGALGIGALQTLLIIAILFERGRRTRAQAALNSSFLQVQDLAGRLITAQEAERTRIAGELHDDVVQEVAGLSITLGRLAKRAAPASAGEDMQPALTLLQQRTIGVAEKIRHLSHDLHPGVLQHAGLVAALTSHCAECQRQQAVDVVLQADDGFESLDPEAALCLYRVAQEALRNVFTHAGAGKAVVRLTRTEHDAELTVADDGKGFDVRAKRAGRGLGLLSIHERIRLAGGTVDVLTEPNKGTTIKVRIPLIKDRTGTIGGVSGSERVFG